MAAGEQKSVRRRIVCLTGNGGDWQNIRCSLNYASDFATATLRSVSKNFG